ncbi:zinc ABC transporter ATP-binding protein AztA [Paenirhodobacter populi]|uniref:zinc ABC transporter ATP-binding protein AztA n=1 Tax=Paenirhodobacter populi TaxID=2306993 RepID=UPI000FE43437|nr:zinc ABC transporter ATP-binding protein AztA [Sinirhodobacter populi]RWR10260.1 ABC transporter ATP-binding protein [Sinirhodobacter populi]
MISFKDLTLAYDRQPAVHHLTGHIARGALLALVGPNGAGKTTLMRAIAGDFPAAEGELKVDTKRIAWLPQQADVDRQFPIDVRAFVAMGLWARIGAFRDLGRKGRARVDEALAAVGLSGFGARPISALSGGQMQRVLFARLMLQDAELCLLDEPFAAVDARTTEDLMALLHQWRAEGRTVIAVLHDMDLVRRHFPEALLIAREKIAQGPTAEVLSEANLARARLALAPDDRAPLASRAAA